MANRIVFKYDQMNTAATAITEKEAKFKSDGQKLITDLKETFSKWEGSSATAFDNLLDGRVNEFIVVQIPNLIDVLVEEIKVSSSSMKETDDTIAGQIK
ncbi:hypothetical protein FACS1894132_06010 [Clostridia bacterium]|nr:hypothetical protein FACS1894132_06010 [Clostridia bacterium]